MNKKKLTLLIALSIIIVITVTTFIVEAVKPETKVETIATVKDIDPLPPSSVEESIIEEEVIKEEPKVELLSIEEIAKQVINGNWGSGEERKTRLTEAGYNYDEVQAKVAELMPKPQSIIKPAAAITKTEAMQIAWNVMRNKGWSKELCAAIIGNMIAESNINPYAGGDGGSSYGLCQWHKGRKIAMLNFNGKNYNTRDNLPPIEHQIDYLEYELQKGYSDILNSNGTCEDIAYKFCVEFERPSNKYTKGEARKELARGVYNTFA